MDMKFISFREAAIFIIHQLLRGSLLTIRNESNFFNLGSSKGYSVKEMLEAAREVTGKEIPAEIAPRRAGDPSRLVASSEKAREILGWNVTQKYFQRCSIIQ
ncbi:hypothetical protein EfmAA242_18370 [Enterococcus faecium]|nr:hypothetical protein EfmAA242_18370 [Enterococcus faecium]